MAQVKISARRDHIDRVRATLSDTVHRALQDTLGLPPDKRFHRFIALDGAEFVHPPDRSERYTILEIVIFEGRRPATKRDCLRRLMDEVPRATGIAAAGLGIVILESPRSNWGIHGRIGGELQPSYRVET
jgi:hypothetical protein